MSEKPVSSKGFRSSADVAKRPIIGFGRNGKRIEKQVTVAKVDGHWIFEGDIVVRERSVHEAVAITGARFRWPNATIPYRIADGFPNPERVTDAIAHWEAQTKIRFVKRTDQADYVTFADQGGCFSSIGRQGGEQIVSLGKDCTMGNAIHEIGHTVGLWHEQSRADRADHIAVHLENVLSGYEHNFDQHIEDGTDLVGYDYGSIMHYPRDAFSKNGEDTLVPSGGQEIGQRTGLSAGDIAGVAALYP
jgi:Astacin (Peptidase family M12A)